MDYNEVLKVPRALSSPHVVQNKTDINLQALPIIYVTAKKLDSWVWLPFLSLK